MFHTKYIHWRFILNIGKRKVDKLSIEILQNIPNGKITVSEPYYKSEDRYLIEVEQTLVDYNFEAIFILLIQTSNCFSYSWSVNLSISKLSDNWPMSGVCNNNIRIPGIEWISFDPYIKKM